MHLRGDHSPLQRSDHLYQTHLVVVIRMVAAGSWHDGQLSDIGSTGNGRTLDAVFAVTACNL